MTLETKDDRTLFFDMLPSSSAPEGHGGAMSLRIKVFTVPGQVLHSSTRRLVLQGADGVAFIADSHMAETEHNAASFFDLRANLKELGLSVKTLPLVIQFNKRDMPNVRSDAEIESLASKGREPVFKASAVKGTGSSRRSSGSSTSRGPSSKRSTSSRRSSASTATSSSQRRRRSSATRGRRRPPARVRRGGAELHGSGRGGAVMTAGAARPNPLDAIAIEQTLRLEELVNREALNEMLRSFYALFGIPLKIFSGDNMLLGDAGRSRRSARTWGRS